MILGLRQLMSETNKIFLSLSTRELHKLRVKNPSVENSDTAVYVFDP
jgi:hypothetical protein